MNGVRVAPRTGEPACEDRVRSRSHTNSANGPRGGGRPDTLGRMPLPARPDRYADAVRSRRAELRETRALLLGGHRAELRSCLAGCRVSASAELATVLADFGRELRHHADRADKAG